MSRERVVQLLKWLLAVAVIGWLLASGGLELERLSELGERWPWFLAAQGCYATTVLFSSLRWRLLLRAQALEERLVDVAGLNLVGLFMNQLVFGSTGGDVARAYLAAARHPGRASAAALSVVVDRAIGLSLLLVVALGGGLLNFRLVADHPELASALAATGAACALAAAGATALFSPRLRRLSLVRTLLRRAPFQDLLRRLDAALQDYRGHRGALGSAAALSVLLHGANVATNLCLAMSLFGGPFDARAFLVLVPLALAFMAVPLNPPGALGTGEAAYQHLLALAGFPAGGLVCVLQRLTFALWSIPGAIVYAMGRWRTAGREQVDRADWASRSRP